MKLTTTSIADHGLGFRLRMIRLSVRLSQHEVAQALSTDVSRIRAIERGREVLFADMMIRLKCLYNVDVQTLFDTDGMQGVLYLNNANDNDNNDATLV